MMKPCASCTLEPARVIAKNELATRPTVAGGGDLSERMLACHGASLIRQQQNSGSR